MKENSTLFFISNIYPSCQNLHNQATQPSTFYSGLCLETGMLFSVVFCSLMSPGYKPSSTWKKPQQQMEKQRKETPALLCHFISVQMSPVYSCLSISPPPPHPPAHLLPISSSFLQRAYPHLSSLPNCQSCYLSCRFPAFCLAKSPCFFFFLFLNPCLPARAPQDFLFNDPHQKWMIIADGFMVAVGAKSKGLIVHWLPVKESLDTVVQQQNAALIVLINCWKLSKCWF